MLKLKQLRKMKNLTQEQIAQIINSTTTCYNYYEKEKRQPSIETLCKLADFYGVSLDYLVGRQFINEVGYLTEEQKNVVFAIKKLNDANINKILTQTLKMLDEQ